MRRVLPLLLAPLLAACSVVGIRTGTEEPRFTPVARLGDVEIRRYAPRTLAEVEVAARDEAAARSAGFSPLAAYIFGRNRDAERIGMTAPVAQAPGPGAWRIGFVMPARYAPGTLPSPEDPAIALRDLPEETVAVLRFTGSATAAQVAAARERLLDALAASPWEATGAGGAWFYDPPWTLPAARRNEVWVPARPRAAARP